MSKKIADIYHNLAVMLDAGVPINRSLKVAASGAKGKYAKAVNGLIEGVAKGDTVSEAMAASPKLFDPLDILVVEAGESSGELARCFNQLSAWYSFQNRLRQMIRQGMVLPVFVLHIGAFVSPLPGVFLGAYTVRQAMMQAIAALSGFYIPLVAIILLKKFGARGNLLRIALDEISIRIPVIKKAVMALAISRFTNAFYTLYSAGIPIVSAVDKACQITGNTAVIKMFEGGVTSARAGNDVSAGFSRDLPADYIASWEVGEESGQLDTVTKRLAIQTQERAERMFAELARWLPRVVYFIVSGFIILGIFRGYSQIGMKIQQLIAQ